MKALVIIPARMAATRLPGKPLADIHGQPMIIRCWRAAVAAKAGPVLVAAGDAEIAAAVTAAGGQAVLTDPDLPSGSDRVWQAACRFDPDANFDVIVNLQGDMPAPDPEMLRRALLPLADPAVDIATAAAEITDPAERDNPAVVKVFAGFRAGAGIARALAFSRARIPHGDGPLYHHIGVYAFRRAALARFVALPETVLERRERLEQLRALEDGMRIDVALTPAAPMSVDTPEDLERARRLLAS